MDTGLTNGVTYYYQVSAVNGAGEGPRSAEVSATPATPPSPPEDLAATPGDAWIRLSWEAPSSDGGSPIIGYRIYRGTASGAESFLIELGSLLAWTDTSAANGVTYFYQVRAFNAVGEGPSSLEVSAMPIGPTAPAQILSLTATAGTGRVTLAWERPPDGGSPIRNYYIYRGTTPGGESYYGAVGTVLAYSDTDVNDGVTYYYRVSAVNAVGEGPLSPEVSATPYVPNTPPEASFTVTPSSGDTSTMFTVDASSSFDVEDPTVALQVRWDWESDENPDTSWSNVKTAEHRYTTPGTYAIDLFVKDTGGLISSITVVIMVTAPPVVDTTKPMVTIATPANGSIVTSSTVTLSGSASDDVAVQTVELSTDETTWILATGTTSWSGTLTLAEGMNTIYVRATDTSGNVATTSIGITVQTTVQAPQGLDPMAIGLVAAAVVGVAAGATVLVLRKRRKA